MKSRRIPAYTHHKPTGQARVRINGKSFYLGKYGSPESHDRYDSLISEFVIDSEPNSSRTLTTVLAAWWAECQRRYTKGKGKLGGAQNWRPIIRLLRTHHGDERAEDLGPVKLRKLLEAEGEREGWSLTYTRMQLARVKQIFKWAAAEELVGITAYQRLQVCEIRNGRKSKPIPPASDSVVDTTLPQLKLVVADMVRFQRLTGTRPGELVAMQRDHIDRSGEIWIYTPSSHKTEHHGKSRTIYIGPKAQAILAPWLLKAVDGSCSIWTWRNGEAYSTDSYRRAVHRAVERINAKRLKDDPKAELLPKWAPNQIRKAAATSIRAALDVEHAAAVLGHSSSVVTGEHYAAANRERAIEAVKLLGYRIEQSDSKGCSHGRWLVRRQENHSGRFSRSRGFGVWPTDRSFNRPSHDDSSGTGGSDLQRPTVFTHRPKSYQRPFGDPSRSDRRVFRQGWMRRLRTSGGRPMIDIQGFAVDPAKFQSELNIPSAHGTRRFGDCMADFQAERFAGINPALLSIARGEKPDIGRHWWEATKGASKDSDLAVCLLWLLAFTKRPLACQVGAADADQADELRKAAKDISGITRDGRSAFPIHETAINGPLAVRFLKHLLRWIDDRLLVIWDGSPIHRSRVVKDWLRQTDGRVWLERLPGYAPDLNPDEAVWNHLKHVQLANVGSPDLPTHRQELHNAIRRFRRREDLIPAFFHAARL